MTRTQSTFESSTQKSLICCVVGPVRESTKTTHTKRRGSFSNDDDDDAFVSSSRKRWWCGQRAEVRTKTTEHQRNFWRISRFQKKGNINSNPTGRETRRSMW